jgi:hypothetical protein
MKRGRCYAALWKGQGVIDTIALELFPDDEAQQERCKGNVDARGG